MDLKQLTPTQLAVGAGLLVLLLVLLLLLWLLGRSRGKARRRRVRTEAALADAPTAGLAAPPTQPTPTQPPPLPPAPGPGRAGPAPVADSGAGRAAGAGSGDAGLTLFGSTPQYRGPYRVVQHSGDSVQPHTGEPYPDDGLAAEQERLRSSAPPQPRTSLEPTFDQPDRPWPARDPAPGLGAESGSDSRDLGSGSASGAGAPRADLPPAPVGWPRSGSSTRDSSQAGGGDGTGRGSQSPEDRPGSTSPGSSAPAEGQPDHVASAGHAPDRGPEPEPAVALSAGHPERNGLAAVPEPGEGGPGEGGPVNGLTGDAKDRLLRVLLADPDRALHAVGDLEASRSQLDRLNDSVHYQRRQLADAARRLRGAGLTPAQVAELAGFGEGELATLLAEHTPSPTPRPTPDPPH